jgi:hypothetical protein
MMSIESKLTAVLYQVNLRGGGADYACSWHLPDAREERAGSLVSVARIDDPQAECVYCFIRRGEAARG